jgi:putative ABC transport system permease protein
MIGNAIVLALREIRRNLMRAALTTLGIVIGVGAVIAMVTLGTGAQASITGTIAGLGHNLIVVQPGAQRQGGPPVPAALFTLQDAAAVRREVSGLRAVAPIAMRPVTAVAGNRNRTTQAIGTEGTYLDARDWPLAMGRTFGEGEERSGRPVCVIGQTVRDELFGRQDPLAAQIRVGQIPCTVIGVLTSKGQSIVGQDQDDLILMPLRTVQRRIAGNTDVNLILIAVNRAEDITAAKRAIEGVMRERRHVREGQPDDFSVNDLREIANTITTVTTVLTVFLSAIAAVSLLVGGIGIMNIMLVSVTERTREIGIRLAIGARERDVLL